MLIRDLKTLDDCRQVVALERTVWGYTDSEDVVPAPVLITAIKRGGILLGAFDAGGSMKGFVYSIPGIKDGRLTQWSHMLGVTEDARNDGLGLQLKLAQRERALAMGIDLVEWTFDPLQALNAHLNFTKLGVVVEKYEENIYGESSSPLHTGSPTDRFVAEWRLTAPHVERRIAGGGVGLVRDASVDTARLVNPARARDGALRPADADLSREERRLLVEIPGRYGDMLAADPALALDWRMSTRRIFQHYFARGYRAVDFFLASDRSRGHYLLARDSD
jgi:chorismate synthase